MGYLRNRLIQAIITIYSIVTLGFAAIQLMPGGPAAAIRSQINSNPAAFGLPPDPTFEQINQVLQERMLVPPDQPLWEAYLTYMMGALQGNLGESIIVNPGTSNVQLILEAAPWSIFLSSVALVYGLVVGIVLGSLMAYYEGSRFDVGMTITVILNSAVPFYIAAIVLLYFGAYQLGWFPTGGRFNTSTNPGFNWPFIQGIFYHAALPVASLVITGFGGQALSMRANSIRILGSDYIRVAELRGLSSYKISTRYLARNAILPMYTGIIIGLGGMLGGTVILEEIFAYPGMGMLMFDATVMRDFPLLTANLIIVTILFVIGTLIADFTYALIDPRAEQSSMG